MACLPHLNEPTKTLDIQCKSGLFELIHLRIADQFSGYWIDHTWIIPQREIVIRGQFISMIEQSQTLDNRYIIQCRCKVNPTLGVELYFKLAVFSGL